MTIESYEKATEVLNKIRKYEEKLHWLQLFFKTNVKDIQHKSEQDKEDYLKAQAEAKESVTQLKKELERLNQLFHSL